ncbi:hypothetical protein [Peribacillus acanthi]|uniref:hypothetical protein n=1 Tax=Peribacillus acanthi TaxID=2171554 RepID=UPI000D3E62E8|nr:hypothetical protein [Peribacillus acanthi]
MFKLQIVNADSNAILREETYQDNDFIINLINQLENNQGINDTFVNYLFDQEGRMWDGIYCRYNKVLINEYTVYRFFYRMKISTFQPKIKHRMN